MGYRGLTHLPSWSWEGHWQRILLAGTRSHVQQGRDIFGAELAHTTHTLSSSPSSSFFPRSLAFRAHRTPFPSLFHGSASSCHTLHCTPQGPPKRPPLRGVCDLSRQGCWSSLWVPMVTAHGASGAGGHVTRHTLTHKCF